MEQTDEVGLVIAAVNPFGWVELKMMCRVKGNVMQSSVGMELGACSRFCTEQYSAHLMRRS
ncbi:hypothetical protein GCM10008022_31880 [Paenibacillus hunanensis]|nr:hypothetical protein GCM10008022_31880 [Paenibacillus hunanensis]